MRTVEGPHIEFDPGGCHRCTLVQIIITRVAGAAVTTAFGSPFGPPGFLTVPPGRSRRLAPVPGMCRATAG